MKKIIIFKSFSSQALLITVITIIIFITIIISRQETPVSPVNPSPAPSLTPSPTPKTFQFDSSTDLREELDKVNPQVLDSDFNE